MERQTNSDRIEELSQATEETLPVEMAQRALRLSEPDLIGSLTRWQDAGYPTEVYDASRDEYKNPPEPEVRWKPLHDHMHYEDGVLVDDDPSEVGNN